MVIENKYVSFSEGVCLLIGDFLIFFCEILKVNVNVVYENGRRDGLLNNSCNVFERKIFINKSRKIVK